MLLTMMEMVEQMRILLTDLLRLKYPPLVRSQGVEFPELLKSIQT